MGNPGPEWRIWANIDIFPIFYSIFMKIGQEAHFCIQNNMELWGAGALTYRTARQLNIY